MQILTRVAFIATFMTIIDLCDSYYHKKSSSEPKFVDQNTYEKQSIYGSPSPYGITPPDPFSGVKKKGMTHSSTHQTHSSHMKGCGEITLINSIIECSSTTCIAKCFSNYQFPNGNTQLTMKCVESKWEIKGIESTTLPPCQPVCLPHCQNNGICIAPGQCNCPQNFEGPQCQYKHEPCLSFPNAPVNGRRNCTSKVCHITCMHGHKFEDDSSMITMNCQNGQWISRSNTKLVSPKCIPQCNPPCKNGGMCLSLDVCQCPPNFRGPQCQYSTDNCNARKLGFNGGYKCKGSSTEFSCTLSCPAGILFDSAVADVYVCAYETGIFLPQPIPQCVYSKDDILTQSQSSQYVYNVKSIPQKSQSIFTDDIITKDGGTYNSAIHFPGQDTDYDFSNQLHGGEEEMHVNLPKPGICISWGGAHFKTFDGSVYSYDSACRHILVSDSLDKLFTITLQKIKNKVEISILLRDKEFILQGTDDGGVIFKSSKNLLPIPAQLPGLRVEMAGHMVQATLEGLGANLKWDTKRFIQIEVTESLWNRTEGMCGNIDGIKSNDLKVNNKDVHTHLDVFANARKMKKLGGEQCVDGATQKHSCENETPDKNLKAEKFCKNLISNARFASCNKIMDISQLLDTCKWDYCECLSHDNPENCACDSLSVYASHCVLNGINSLIDWRDQELCMMNCTGGRIYKSCGPPIQVSCGSAIVSENDDDNSDRTCTEGCFCPSGTLFHKGKCVSKDQCPCRLRGKMFSPGATIPKDCNSCTCLHGEWKCTQISCGSRCSVKGDPHYQTFDGKHFDFQGQCTYYLMKGENYSIEAENIGCSGAIDFNYELNPVAPSLQIPSCTKSVVLRYRGTVVELQQNRKVIINGKEIKKLPVRTKGIKIKKASSLYIMAKMDNGLIIWWNGITSAYIDAPPSFRDKTKGLCGTFNSVQNDDFLTPENDVEQSVIPFANKWKTKEPCNDVVISYNPCEKNIQNLPQAQEYCSKLKGKLFEECHWFVDVEQYYQDCLYDMCACDGPTVSNCLCPTLASYATECSNQGVKIDWRLNVKECEVECSGGQVYQVCGDSCTRSCYDLSVGYEDALDLSEEATCRAKCVEGCNCPPGESLNSDGICIPIGSCPCHHEEMEFPPHYKEVRPGRKEQQLCECIAAKWNCKPASKEDIINYPRATDIKDRCNATKNEEFTTCESKTPKTCKTLNDGVQETTEVDCRPGCQCKKGYVFDSITKKCIKPEDCPCHHGGKSYSDGQVMQQDCNTCKCEKGKWCCDERVCDAVCSAWGDSHFTTFDGRLYDFQGVCSYLLSKGQLDSQENSFSIEIQNEICGSAGVTCSKSIVIKVGFGEDMETLVLSQNHHDYNKKLKRIQVRERGLFKFAEIESLDIVVQWDKGTRIYIRAGPIWKGKVKGLCGNYNDNQADDFQTPSGGISESSALLFGDSWKLQSHCPPAYEEKDTCTLYPERRLWSMQKCSILKKAPFTDCHHEVPPGQYIERCEKDTCACGIGGDCECLCTALAAYAHVCAARGIPIKWRTQELCPMQCDETCTQYSPCISSCPVETCDNTLKHQQITKMCQDDICIEGCEHKRPCKSGEIFSNNSYEVCVPRSSCKPVCLTLSDGTKILEGEVVDQDDCHICHCSRGKKICQGEPCTVTVPTEKPNENEVMEEKLKCKTGWSNWINIHTPEKSNRSYSVEVENLPSHHHLVSLGGPLCYSEEITDIQCRTVSGLLSVKEAKVDAECTVEKGLICRQPKNEVPCPDFEIRVFCQCAKPLVQKPENKTVPNFITYECDPAKPNIEFPNDCAKFYQCAPGMGPSEHPNLVEKTCGHDMLYNPVTMICDWPETVKAMKPDCGGSMIVDKCKSGEIWNDCLYNCDRMCNNYLKEVQDEKGICINNEKCVPGCEDSKNTHKCSEGLYFRKLNSCVKKADCPCYSLTGKLVKPGGVVQEGTCEICQCLNNKYVCDTSSCQEEVIETIEEVERNVNKTKQHIIETIEEVERDVNKTKQQIIDITEEVEGNVDKTREIFISSLSPPPNCPINLLKPILTHKLSNGDAEIAATSEIGPSFSAKYAKLNKGIDENSGGSWTPKYSSSDEFIIVKFKHREPLYGIILQGSSLYDQYVTSYSILYGVDEGTKYHATGYGSQPEIFQGPIDNKKPVKQFFNPPIEAKYIKVIPLTWHDSISIRMEFLGCTPSSESHTIYTPVEKTKCDLPLQEMPLAVKHLSSSSNKPNHYNEYCDIEGNNAWEPLTKSSVEWLQFEFPEIQNVTSIVTKGGPNGWVKSFNIKYSSDNIHWNKVYDDDKKVKTFIGNYDNNSPTENRLSIPIRAKYLKVIPLTWKTCPQLRIQPLGCTLAETYKSYNHTTLLTTYETNEQKSVDRCQLCPGIYNEGADCECSLPFVFDGDSCVPRVQCPCIEGQIPYAVGSTYQNAICDTCTCTLGGVPACKKKSCPQCYNGLISTTSSNCECFCVTCPVGHKACPTDNTCIPTSQWCDGAQDCADDETDCFEQPDTQVIVDEELIETTEKQCPVPSCPPGYKVLIAYGSISNRHLTTDSLFKETVKSTHGSYYKGSTKSGVKGQTKMDVPLTQTAIHYCDEWKCIKEKHLSPLPDQNTTMSICAEPLCPPGYKIHTDNEQFNKHECPKYSCTPPPRKDAICNVTHRVFSTFDGIEYQYDICNHILARDAIFNLWDITIQKNCTKKVCVNELVISHQNDIVRFRPDLTIEYNGYAYSVDQTKKIGFESNSFTISKLGYTLFFISKQCGFWVIFNDKGDARIGVAGKLYGRVDGLCGYFNENPIDDRRKPDGSFAISTVDFGNSWIHKDNDIICNVQECPIYLQNKAQDLCKALKNPIFNSCQKVMDIEKYYTRCLESVCDCLLSTAISNDTISKEKNCVCNILQDFVTDCIAADHYIHLEEWRKTMKCSTTCPAPMVHYDCFRRRCQQSCFTYTRDTEDCPATPGVCFSGCFCPEGLIRQGNSCISPKDCKDCVCDTFGKTQYITFDRKNFTLDSNCTYVMARDKLPNEKHSFKVFVTKGDCPNDSDAICTTALHIIFEKHIIHIRKMFNQLHTVVDGLTVMHYPSNQNWIKIYRVSDCDINLVIPSIQLEITCALENFAMTIKLPSFVYGHKMEGLCGNCDAHNHIEFASDNDSSQDRQQWRASQTDLEALGLKDEKCVDVKKDCILKPPEIDPCFKLMDSAIFGKCHNVLDPVSYIGWCQRDICEGASFCGTFEAYARECRRLGVCLEWRRKDFCSYGCKNNLIYKPCGMGCQVTCENYELYKVKPSSCTSPKHEGCFCPEGKVFLNGTCIPFAKCYSCDFDGHYVGDKWQLDECTECSCPKREGGVKCVTTTCSVGVTCGKGFVSQQVAKPAGQCCPEFICVPQEIKENCEEPTKIVCSYGQKMKLDTMSNGCRRFICVCVPPNECEPLENFNKTLEPGMERIVDSTGCCPKIRFECNKKKCQESMKCDKYYELKKTEREGRCCPTLTCEPPNNKCLYKLEYASSPIGGENKRDQHDIETVVKPVGSSWQDGPCRSCVCKLTSTGIQNIPRAVCSVTTCPSAPPSDDFVIEYVDVPFTCCKTYKYSACKYMDTIVKIGDEIESFTDCCVSYQCVLKTDGTLDFRMNIKQCDKNCKPGYKYVPPQSSSICCGECVADACISEGKRYEIGEKWTSVDFCYKYTCIDNNGNAEVHTNSVVCPPISDIMREEFELRVIPVKGQCCKDIKMVACKVNGTIYKIGAEWPSPTNPCITYSCNKVEDGKLEKHTNIKHCETKCKLGYKYVISKPNVCCGECVASTCVMNNIERTVNEEWFAEDFCIKYKCVNSSGILLVDAAATTCPDVKKIKLDFVIEEIKQLGVCCKKNKYIACKVNDKVYKVGEQWESDGNPCVTYMCVQKGDQSLEKRMNVKNCETKCKQGFKYVPSKKTSVCCGECVPYACMVDGIEYPIGKEWASDDFCTNHVCVHANGTLQVRTTDVVCPEVPANVEENYVIEYIPVKGQCCKNMQLVACKYSEEIYGPGATWTSKLNPCQNFTCTQDDSGNLVKTETTETCQEKCPLGWQYVPPNNKNVCCGRCAQIGCVVDKQITQKGDTWFSPDGCIKYSCEMQGLDFIVRSHEKACPDISNCDSDQVYTKGCCKYCNIKALCIVESLPPENTIGLIQQYESLHGECHNKEPLVGFNECKGSCSSGTIYNTETTSHDSDCKCCQAMKYTKLVVDLTCKDGYVFEKQISIPSSCDCFACSNKPLASNISGPWTRNHTKSYSSKLKSARNLVEEDPALHNVTLY